MHQVASLQLTLRPAMALLATIIFTSIVFYGAMLLFAVSHTAHRAQIEEKILQIASRTGALEAKYFDITRTITLQRAQELGFVAPVHTDTVFATAASKALTLQGLQGL